MKVGFDVDGVLAAFTPAYQRLFVDVAGKDLFQPSDDVDPPCWDWPQLRGYDNSVVKAVWERIKADSTFWMNLGEYTDAIGTLAVMLKELERCHDVYYVTDRPGIRTKRQTEIWLLERLGYPLRVPGVNPTVLVSGAKGDIARSLKLDCYIDDKLENVRQVVDASPTTRVYLKNARYNYLATDYSGYTRVDTLGQMFDHEIRGRHL